MGVAGENAGTLLEPLIYDNVIIMSNIFRKILEGERQDLRALYAILLELVSAVGVSLNIFVKITL